MTNAADARPVDLDGDAGQRLIDKIIDPASRPDPYRLYAELRERPVWRDRAGTYYVGRYIDVASLIRDPRLSSDPLNSAQGGAALSFLNMDPPEHDRLRRAAMRHFGPPNNACRVERMTPVLRAMVNSLIDKLAGSTEVDLVSAVSYPLPGTVMADLLGIPKEDEPKFCAWAELIAQATDRGPGQRSGSAERAFHEFAGYMGRRIAAQRGRPSMDMLSNLVNDGTPDAALRTEEVIQIAVLLLLAGHETTVNLISNGMLTLLRYPDVLVRLRHNPSLAPALVEEMLRFEPPVHILFRGTLSDVDVGGSRIPAGSPVQLMLGSANRDPLRFADAHIFMPERENNQHLGFGGGIHGCFGAPLARLEGQIALSELARRLVAPRLVQDPPPYRFNPTLRGPSELRVRIDAIVP